MTLFSSIRSLARRFSRHRGGISSPYQGPHRSILWAHLQLDDGAEGYVPLVALTIGADHHVAFLNLPNFFVGVSGGIKTLVSIAMREQGTGSSSRATIQRRGESMAWGQRCWV